MSANEGVGSTLSPSPEGIRAVERYVHSYLAALQALVSALPEGYQNPPDEYDEATLGRAEIWPCSDGTVILIYRDPAHVGQINTHDPLMCQINQFLRNRIVSQYYSDDGVEYPYQVVLKVGNVATSGLTFSGNQVYDSGGRRTFRPGYQVGKIFGWGAALGKPSEDALQAFRNAYRTTNLIPDGARNLSSDEKRDLSKKRATELAECFSDILRSDIEEDVQKFLETHPELIYPEYIQMIPKFRLGSEYVVDFLFLVQGDLGLEHVFVEIESPKKGIFTKAGHVTSAFTQAEQQLVDWQRWIRSNHAYLRTKLPECYRARYHLIMGRSDDLSEGHREALVEKLSGTDRSFSTYDHLLEKFVRVSSRF
jgi:hypothetical protein